MPRRCPLVVNGEERDACDGRTFVTFDPATGDPLSAAARATEADVDVAVADCRRAFQAHWWRTAPAERAANLVAIAAAIEDHSTELAVLESLDTGKPLREARTDVAVAARCFEFYAGTTDRLAGETIPVGPEAFAFTTREPYGVTGHILPWNYPMPIAARSVAPALAAGNCCVVKPAEQAPLTAVRLAQLALEAELPPGVLNVVPGLGPEAGRALGGHPGVAHLTFTGSFEVGRLVMQYAARNVTPLVLELGGKSPHLVFEDADLDAAVPTIVAAILHNAGQTCSAGSRVLVDRRIEDELVAAVFDAFADVELGRGIDDPDMGPLISHKQLENVLRAVEAAAAEGATVVAGGSPAQVPELPCGAFCEPTLVRGVRPEQPIARRELFGPVLCTTAFSDATEAIEVANSTPYGLVAAVWTRDVERALWTAGQIEAGQVFINSYGGGVELPHGGWKQSGFGRLKGAAAVLEYSQLKTVATVVGKGGS